MPWQGGIYDGMFRNMQFGQPANMGSMQIKPPSFKNMREDIIFELAKYLGIDTTNLTVDQVISLIVAKWHELEKQNLFGNMDVQTMRQMAQRMGIDVGSVQNSDMANIFKTKMDYICSKTELEKAAALLGIDAEDLDDEEIVEAIQNKLDELSAAKLLQLAGIFRINTSNLTEDEIIEKIEDAIEDIIDNSDEDTVLEEAAAFLGIDTKNLEDDEIIAEIKDKLDDLSVSNLLKLANIFGINADDLTSGEIIDKIENILDDM